VRRAYDEADLNRAVQAFRFFYPSVSIMATWKGNLRAGMAANKGVRVAAGHAEAVRVHPELGHSVLGSAAGSLYEAFEPAKARALTERLELHYTPKHGSWLNIAEIGLSRLTGQCPGRRIDDLDLPNTELAAWQAATNDDQRQVDWQFTATGARIKLRHLYPQL
jgi:hypothetical protein